MTFHLRKKIPVLLLVCLLSFWSCNDDSVEPDSTNEDTSEVIDENNNNEEPEEIRCKVKVETQAFDSGIIFRNEWTYDSEGKVIAFKAFSAGSLSSENKNYTYNSNGDVLTHDVYLSGSLYSKVAITYHSSGQISQTINMLELGATYRVDYSYNSNDIENSVKFYTDGSLTSENKDYTYNAEGNITGYDTYSGAGLLVSTFELTYDSYGNKNSQKQYSGGSVLSQQNNYQYDSNDNVISFDSFDGSGSIIYSSSSTYACF